MKVQLQPGWVLHTRPYRDSSLLVELFTRDCGRISMVARGARGSRKRGGSLGALLQPFTPLLCSWSGRSDLKTLTGAEASGTAVQLQGERLFSGLYINELLVRLLHHEDAHQDLYDEYRVVLDELCRTPELELCLRNFEFRLLQELGYGFELAFDGVTGDPLADDCWYAFDPEHGLVEVPDGVQEGVPGAVAHYPGSELLAINRGEFDSRARACAKRLMRQALAVHLGDKPLRSRELFRRPC